MNVVEVTDYVANGSFAALKENVRYLEGDGHAVLVRLVDHNANWQGEKVFVDERAYSFLSKSTLVPGDVVIANVGANAGTVFRVPALTKPMTLGPNAVRVRPRKECAELLSGDFLYYYLTSPMGQEKLQSIITGSAQPKFNKTALRSLALDLPPLPEQQRIASLVAALDDRIARLRETNATLEAIAQALFKSWFVDFDPVHAKQQGIAPVGMDEATAALFPDSFAESSLGPAPAGWSPTVLGAVAEAARMQIQPSEFHAELNYVGLEHIPRKSLTLINWGNAEGLESAKAAFHDGDVLFGKLRPYFHKVVVAPFDGVCSTDILVCNASTPAYRAFVVMQLFSTTLIDYADRLSNGAKMPRISWKDIAAFPVVIPPESVATEYTRVVEPMLALMKSNILEAQTLATLRDTLLPRLISGQLRLPEAQSELEAAV